MPFAVTDTAGESLDPIGDPPERAELRRAVRGMLERECPASRIRELDRAEAFDDELYAHLAKMGILGIDAPESEGGTGDVRDQLVVIEELGAGPTSMAAFLISHYATLQALSSYGSADWHRDIARSMIQGESKVSFALSEAGGGTDVARAMTTTASVRGDGEFALQGAKMWTSGAKLADWIVVLARTAPIERSPVDGISMFLVPRSAPGVRIELLDTFGMHGLSTCQVFFDEVIVPADALLGDLHHGLRQVFTAVNREGLNAAAACIGVARGALDEAVSYMKEREVFGKPIGAFQVPQHWMVDVAVAIESARGLMVRAAEIELGGGRADSLAQMAKLSASEVAVEASLKGMQVLGGLGYTRDAPLERLFRDGRLWSFSPLTNEMVRSRLGQQLLGLPRSF